MSWVTHKGNGEYFGEKVKYWGNDGEMWYKFETEWAANLALLLIEVKLKKKYEIPDTSVSSWGMFYAQP